MIGVPVPREEESLKILNGLSEAVNRRRTDNTTTKRKVTNNNLSDIPEGLAVPAPHVTFVVLLLNNITITWYGNRVGYQYAYINTNNINKA